MTDAIFISDDLVNDGIEHLRGDEIGLRLILIKIGGSWLKKKTIWLAPLVRVSLVIFLLGSVPKMISGTCRSENRPHYNLLTFLSDPSPSLATLDHGLTDSYLVDLIDVTLACEDTNSILS